MNTSGEAAEQVFRMTLDGTEFVIKIAGKGLKNIAALLFAILSQQKKTKGQARIVSMLKSGKELDIFSVKESDLKNFQSRRNATAFSMPPSVTPREARTGWWI